MTKILLAEDDNDMRRFLVKALQNAGYDVASFDNGLSAYNRLREEPFELLLTDIVMPEGINGRALSTRIRAERPRLPVIFTSGYSPEVVGGAGFGAAGVAGQDEFVFHAVLPANKFGDCHCVAFGL